MKTQHALLFLAAIGTSFTTNAAPNERALAVSKYWTAERMAAAQPRDFVLDDVGNAYMRGKDGKLTPYGKHELVSTTAGKPGKPVTRGKPGDGGNDSGATVFSNMTPDGTQTMGDAIIFSATVTDPDSIKSVTFVVNYPNNIQSTSFTPSSTGNNSYSVSVTGFSDGIWSWEVVVKDNAAKGGNTYTSDPVSFTVSTNGGGDTGGGGGDTGRDPTINQITGCDIEVNDEGLVCDGHYETEDAIKTSAGRIYFEMPSNRRKVEWIGYVCSGTVINDNAANTSSIITAAHCVFDDVNKTFAQNVMFIPNQDATTGSEGTDENCKNDPMGCFYPDYGIVAKEWTSSKFPNNIPWDSAFYVLEDANALENVLLSEMGTIAGLTPAIFSIQLGDPDSGSQGSDLNDPSFSQALGYSYEHDPLFRYSQENLIKLDANNWWIPRSRLSGGSSGGPWLQNGSIVSVNSWGYTTSDGMAGPIFGVARTAELFNSIGQPLTHPRGIVVP